MCAARSARVCAKGIKRFPTDGMDIAGAFRCVRRALDISYESIDLIHRPVQKEIRTSIKDFSARVAETRSRWFQVGKKGSETPSERENRESLRGSVQIAVIN